MIGVLKLPAATQSVIAVARSLGSLPNLERLALEAPNPMPLDDLAAAIGVRFELLHRVSHYRQPLPRRLVALIAAKLGVQSGEVEAAATSVSDAGIVIRASTSTSVSFGALAENPLPPDRCLGDAIYPRPLAATVAPTFGA